MIKIFNYFWQAIFIYFFFILGRILGIRLSRKLFAYLFLYLGQIFKSKKTIEKNLRIFLKNNSQFDEKKIISEMWKNYGKTFIEYIYLNQLRKNNSHINLIGEENLSLILKDKKPVIFVSGHFANFELMSMEITKRNIKLATIYRPLNNIFLNPFMEYLRKTFVCKNQIKKGINGVRDAINFIKNDHSIALMIDQRVSEGILSNFFNKKAHTTTIPAQLVKKYGYDVVPISIERFDHIKFNIRIHKPLKYSKNTTTEEITQNLNNFIEKMLIKNPNQWIWSHNRWK